MSTRRAAATTNALGLEIPGDGRQPNDAPRPEREDAHDGRRPNAPLLRTLLPVLRPRGLVPGGPRVWVRVVVKHNSYAVEYHRF